MGPPGRVGEEGEKEVGGEEVGREEGGVKGPMEMNVGRHY